MKALADSMQIVEAAGLKPHAHVCVGDSGEMILAFARRLNSRPDRDGHPRPRPGH